MNFWQYLNANILYLKNRNKKKKSAKVLVRRILKNFQLQLAATKSK